ncbi:MAG: hypothetical protein MZV64_03760 [Ignavibacteriales bacterium]|nr:hypothetical protein [Ignavibacteriales bacterium]
MHFKNRYSFGGIWDFGDWGRAYLELGTTRIDMEQRVEGVVRNNTTMELIPVNAKTDASRTSYDFNFVYANRFIWKIHSG